MARDCTEPRKLICRNCTKEGHLSRECPEPLDTSKVQCRNCDEFGHFSKQCPKPLDCECFVLFTKAASAMQLLTQFHN